MFARWQVLIPLSALLLVSPSVPEWTSPEMDCIGVPPGETPEHSGNASIILDEILGAVSTYLRKVNHTQMDIPDQESDFEFFLLKGHLSLNEGKVSGYDSITRNGDALVQYLERGTSGSAAVKFDDASFFYDTKVKISSSTFQGKIKASLEQLSMRMNISVNLTSLCKKIHSLEVENLNSIKVLVDIKSWIPSTLTNTLVNTVTWIYKNRLVPAIEERTAKAIQTFLDSIDLDDVLRPDPIKDLFSAEYIGGDGH